MHWPFLVAKVRSMPTEREGRGRWVFTAIGALPLLLVYALIHTPWLKPLLPEARWLAVVILFFVPLAWFGAVMRLYRWWAAREPRP